jgi:hypothetical protein
MSINYAMDIRSSNGRWVGSTESMIRGFHLISSSGEEVSLNGEAYFASNPKGLGISVKNEINNVRDTRYLVDSDYEPDDISFDLIVAPTESPEKSAYQNFLGFISYLRGGVVTLKYDIPLVGTFYRDVAFKELSKTELNQAEVLAETLTFEPITYWYRWEDQMMSDSTGAAKDYAFTINGTSILEHQHRAEVIIKNISTNQTIVNPSFTCSANKLYHTGLCGYNVSIGPGQAIKMGNLKAGHPYAFIFKPSDESNNLKNYYPSDKDSRYALSYEMPNCITPIYVVDGRNTVHFNAMKDSSGNTVKYRFWIRVKVEYPII